MSKARAFARTQTDTALVAAARMLIVTGCALALILAGPVLPL